MNPSYWTPIKQTNGQDNKLYNTQHQLRSGNWLCAYCKNVNYSFRKKCNRCKTQSKKKDQTASVYSYYYYNKQNSRQQKHSSQSSNNHQSQNSRKYEYKTPSYHQRLVDTRTPQKRLEKACKDQDGLPSVSPLVKKYRQKQHHTTLQKISSFQLDQNAQKFLQSIQVRDFDDLLNENILNFDNQIGNKKQSKVQMLHNISFKATQNQLRLRKYVSCNLQNRNQPRQNESQPNEQMSEMDLYMLQMQEIIGRIII